jgi:hypothetical protein
MNSATSSADGSLEWSVARASLTKDTVPLTNSNGRTCRTHVHAPGLVRMASQRKALGLVFLTRDLI